MHVDDEDRRSATEQKGPKAEHLDLPKSVCSCASRSDRTIIEFVYVRCSCEFRRIHFDIYRFPPSNYYGQNGNFLGKTAKFISIGT